MKNIFRVFLMDARRLSTNVVAIVIIMGLCIVPVLYAWFNILSNWDPYGQDATSKMHIAVYSEDQGVTYADATVNVGNSVIEGLKSNDTIGWEFPDTKEDALQSVYSGDCYAAFVIPTDFTEKIISFISGDPENPQIIYYENSKKNAIATKITGKVKTTIQQTVNTSFISTLTEVASKSGEVITGADGSNVNMTKDVIDKLKEVDSQLTTYANVLNTLALVTDSAGGLVDSTQSLIPNVGDMADSGQGAIANMQQAVMTGAQTADSVASMMDICLDSVISGLDNVSAALSNASIAADYAGITEKYTNTEEIAEQTLVVLADFMGDSEEYRKAAKHLDALSSDIDKLSSDATLTQEKMDELVLSISDEIDSCNTCLKDLKSTFDYEIVPSLNTDIYSVQSTLIEAETLLAGLDTDFTNVNLALQSYKDTLATGTQSISDTAGYVTDLQKNLHKLCEDLEDLSSSEQYEELTEMLRTDPSVIAEFITSPVQMDTVSLFKIETYGSAMAPFYTILALWVGALITVALVHVGVEDEGTIPDLKQWQCYFGRYITFFLIGQIQTLITVLGDLFYIRIQCLHPFRFWLASACASLVFTLLMYSLTVALGNIGQAAAVIIMVVQVAGAGCTFPVEVLPEVFQKLYPFLPFVYCMNALRACVGGIYQLEYVKDIGVLGIYVLVSLFIGLVLVKPFAPLLKIIDKSKEKAGLMM